MFEIKKIELFKLNHEILEITISYSALTSLQLY